MEGLEGLVLVGRFVTISGNGSLSSLQALHQIGSIGQKLTIRGNPVLPLAEVEAWTAVLSERGFDGETNVQDNGS